MTQPRQRRASWGGVPIRRRDLVLGAAVVGVFLAVDLGAVLYANNWIGPARLTPQMFLDGFVKVFGRQPGFRKNHAKGVAVAGYFDSNGNGREVSSAAVFRSGRTPVLGRFSLAGGNAHAADMAATARGLGLAFGFPGGAQWRTAMLNLPVFPDSSPQGFYDRLLASKPSSGTGKPDPKAMAAFLADIRRRRRPWRSSVRVHLLPASPTARSAASTRSTSSASPAPDPGPLVAGAGHAPAVPKIVRAQRALRCPCPPDPFRPAAMDVDAHRRRTV